MKPIRKTFNFYRSYYDVLQKIPTDKEKLDYLLAICNRQFEGIEPSLEGYADFAYTSQKHSIDKQVEGWESKMKTKLNQPTEDPTQGGSVGPTKGGSEGPWQQEKEKEKEEEKEQEEVKEEEDLDSYLDSLITNKEKLIMETRKPKIKEPIVPKLPVVEPLSVEAKPKEKDTINVLDDFVDSILSAKGL